MSAHRRLLFSRLSFEELEDRRLLTTLAPPYYPTAVRVAYGLANAAGGNQITLGTTNIDGSGQTIAILELNNPSSSAQLTADLHTFDTNTNVNLPDATVTVFDAPGVTAASPVTDVFGQQDMDMEWAHAMAPGANIYIVMVPVVTTSAQIQQIDAAAQYAASLPGVSVVTIGYSLTNRSTSGAPQGPPSFPYAPTEFATETGDDADYLTPAGHQGVTFVASTGDNGTASWPATSPNVLAVGGTTLSMTTVTTTGTPPVTTYAYGTETYWNSPNGGTFATTSLGVGGAGLSQYETEPAYQQNFQSSGQRSVPDLSLVADYNNTPLAFYFHDLISGANQFTSIGPGSGLNAQLTAGLPAALMAGILADVNQERVMMGGTTLNGTTQTLPALYGVSNTDFNPMSKAANIANTTISATGLGSPKANLLIPDLAAYGLASTLSVSNLPASVAAGSQYVVNVSAQDSAGNIDLAATGPVLVNGSESQIVSFSAPLTTPAFGTFGLKVDGVNLSVTYPSTPSQANMAAAIQNALNSATAPLGPGTTVVSAGPNSQTILITFTGSLTNVKVPQSSSTNGSLTGTSLTASQPQVITFANTLDTAATGTFNLSIGGQTIPVAYPTTASQANMLSALQTALLSVPLPGIPQVTPGPSASTAIVTFFNLPTGVQAPAITYDNGTLSETQTISFGASLTTLAQGTFNLIIDGVFVPVTYPTTPTQANMVAAIQTALNSARAPLGNGTTVVSPGASGSTIAVKFLGSLANNGAPQITSNNGTLIGNTVSTAIPQIITFQNALNSPGSGTFNLVIDGVTVTVTYPPVPTQPAMVSAIQKAIDGAAAPLGPGMVLVTAPLTTTQITLTYVGNLANQNLPPIGFTAGTPLKNPIVSILSGGVGNIITSIAGPMMANGTATVFVTAPTKGSLGSQIKLAADNLMATAFIKVGAAGGDQLLVSTEPPSSVNANSPFGMTVEVVDGFGNVDTNFSGTVTVALANNPSNATLSGTLTQTITSGMGVFTDLALSAAGIGYTLSLTSQSLSTATTPINIFNTLTIQGNANDNITISFPDAQDFIVDRNGVQLQYPISQYDRLLYQGPTKGFSSVIFDDPNNAYVATQTLSSTQVIGSTFAFEGDNVANLYIYAGAGSTANINVTAGTGSNFYVDDSKDGYSYIADPIKGIFSQLIGFGAETVTGSGGSTYAYLYSTSKASVVMDPQQSSITVGGVQTTLAAFSQTYVVGSADGTDRVSLQPDHAVTAQFVATPTFSYITGSFKNASFIFGAIDAATVVAQPSIYATDTAFFESFPGNAFNASPTTSTLSGSATSLLGTDYSFTVQASNFLKVSVLESGSGTDTVNLTSTGGAVFIGSSTVDTMTIGLTTITVNTYIASGSSLLPAANTVTVVGAGNSSDSAFLYDSPGGNAAVANGDSASLTTSKGTTTVSNFGAVTFERQNGSTDTLHEGIVDFVVSTVGNWTST